MYDIILSRFQSYITLDFFYQQVKQVSCLSIFNMDQESVNMSKVQEPITQATPEVRTIIERVLKLEKERLYQKNNRYINDDILKIIKDVVR